MKKTLLIALLGAALSGCGNGGGSAGSSTGTLSFNITDAPVDDADHVVVTIDKVTLRREGADDIVVDRFTIPSLSLNDEDTFQIDLLDYQQGRKVLIIDGLEVPAGTYSQLILEVIDNDLNASYVEIASTRTPIKQPSHQLKLGGFTVDASGVYTYTLDFDLRQAMTYNPGPDRYILKPRGVRIISEELAGSLSGTIDENLFDTSYDCSIKDDPTKGNVVYLYQGDEITGTLTDIFDPDLATGVPADAVRPYAAATVYYDDSNSSWRYFIGSLPAGAYTVAFSCNAEADAAESYDEITISLPSDAQATTTISAGQNATVNFVQSP